MEFEYWWLLGFPLFFGLGWLAARIDIRHLVRESRALPRSYFRGLNFLLSEQPDKAIEAFMEVVTVAPQTADPRFALGSLFGRRGECDHAIRMHQNLVERTDLAADQRAHALFEVGLDDLKAGILDRAEEVFSRLLEGPRAVEARRHLLEIYQTGKEWQKAIEIARRIETDSGEARTGEISHFLCELAADDAMHSRPDGARAHLEQALEANRRSVRASVQLGDLERAAGNTERAIEHWKRVESQNPPFVALVAQRLLHAHRDAGRLEEGLTLIAGYLERYPSLDLLDSVFQYTLDAKGATAAYRLVRDELRRNPTLLGLDRLLEAQIMGDSHPERRRDLELVKNLVHSHTRKLARYRCENCGFKARQFHWRWPGGGGWETYPPKRSEGFGVPP